MKKFGEFYNQVKHSKLANTYGKIGHELCDNYFG